MKKFKVAPQNAKRIKVIVAAAMALTMAVPTSIHFSSKEATAKAEESVTVPEPIMKVDFEKGFMGESAKNGLSVVKSEEVLEFEEYKKEDGTYYVDQNKHTIYKYTDVPFIEGSVYKRNVIGNQPVTAYDVSHGSVLMLDDTVKVGKFTKKASDKFDETTPVGVVLQNEYTAQSQAKLNNPFAGKTLTKTDAEGRKGVTISYWVKFPDTSDVNSNVNLAESNNRQYAGNVSDSSLIVFNNTSRVVMQKDDRGKYDACVAYDTAKAANDTATLAKYSLGNQKIVTDAQGNTYNMYENYGNLVRLNPDYPVASTATKGGGWYASNTDGKVTVTDAAGKTYKILSFAGDTTIDKNQYQYYRYFYSANDDKANGYSKDSKIRRDTISGSMQITAQDDFHFAEDSYFTEKRNIDGVEQVFATGTAVSNPNSDKYGTVQNFVQENQFFFDGDETVTDDPGVWHYITAVIQNDWVSFYVDGVYQDPEESFSYMKDKDGIQSYNFGSQNEENMFNEGKGLRGVFGYPASNIKEWSADGRLLEGPGNKYGITMLDWLTDANTQLFIGGNGIAAQRFFQEKGTNVGTLIDDLTFYDEPLSEEQAIKAYENAVAKMAKNESVIPDPIAKFTFDDGSMNSTIGSNNLTAAKSNLEGKDPTVQSGLLKTETSKAAGTSAVVLKTNPFAGKDLTGATVSYWVKMPAAEQSATVSFLDTPKVMNYDKLDNSYKGKEASTLLYVDTAEDAQYMEGYTFDGYLSVGNKYLFRTQKNGNTDPTKTLYDVESVAKAAEWKQRLANATEWHYVTAIFTNYEIQLYYDGQKLIDNQVDENGKRTCYAPRFFDGWYNRMYDNFSSYYKPSNNQGELPLMSFLTDPTTSAYIGYKPALASSTTFEKTYASYYDDIAYYDVALTDAQAKLLYSQQTKPGTVATDTPTTAPTPVPTPGPTDKVTEQPISVDSSGKLIASANGVTFNAEPGVIAKDAKLTLGYLGAEASASVYSAFKNTLDVNKDFATKDFIVYTATAKDVSGNAITANGNFTLTFDIPSGYDAKSVVVVGEDGKVYEGTLSEDGTKITITTNKFGNYAVVQKDMSTDDGSSVASAASKSGKTGDTANVAIPFMILAIAGATLVVSYKKKAFQK